MQKIKLGKKILKELKNHDYEAYFVGGFVRDYILKKELNDIDIATSAHPEQVMGLFTKSIPTGLKHGTVTVLEEGVPFEVTTFRTEENYKDFRHPEKVSFVSSIIQDLARRDFTMNAMAMDEEENIIDPFDGKYSLDSKTIIAVGDPTLRLHEDPLRMMRAIRFAAQLNFSIDTMTWKAIKENKSYIKYIAVERIKGEFDKIMTSDHPDRGIELLFSSSMIYWIKNFQGIRFKEDKIVELTKKIIKTNDITSRWFLFLYPLHESDRNNLMSVLKFSNREKKDVQFSFHAFNLLKHSFSIHNIKRCLLETGRLVCQRVIEILYLLDYIDQDAQLKYVKLVHELDQNMQVRTTGDLDISGSDLIDFFQKSSGPWVKELLQILLNAVIYEDVENKKERLFQKAIKEMKGKENAR